MDRILPRYPNPAGVHAGNRYVPFLRNQGSGKLSIIRWLPPTRVVHAIRFQAAQRPNLLEKTVKLGWLT